MKPCRLRVNVDQSVFLTCWRRWWFILSRREHSLFGQGSFYGRGGANLDCGCGLME